ncbi:MAG: LytTR family DNA-binding domain-containing protein [Eubacteriales bacterium]|nr:LytTR family DNA-binding domain-containing protein [Eubacteriales bacterium]
MRIAVIDDNASDRKTAIALAKEYFNQRKEYEKMQLVFDEYDSAEAFFNSYIKGVYDILFLDIYMRSLTGIDLARQISFTDENCHIIFLTSSEEHYPESYEVHAKGYVTKPLRESSFSFCNALDYVMKQFSLQFSGITLSLNGAEAFCALKEIMFFEMNNGRLYLHLIEKTLELSGRYSDYSTELLKDSRFMECYRNLIVNMDYIHNYTEDSFLLKNEEAVPISRRKKQMVLNQYIKYFLGKGKH